MSDSERSGDETDHGARYSNHNSQANNIPRSNDQSKIARNEGHGSGTPEFISGRRNDHGSPAVEPEKEFENPSFKADLNAEAAADYPVDGKFAFWQSFLVMLMTFSTWGANGAFGVFLNYYLNADYFPGATKYDFALMGGVVVFLAQALAPFCTFTVRVFGQTPIYIVGICLQTLGYFLAAECKKFWQLFLCQGILVGLSFSLIFIPGTLVIPTWFDKWKALAMGIAVSGAGIGGLVFSLSLNRIIEQTGNQKWALRAAGLINLAVSSTGAIFMRPRNSSKTSLRSKMNRSFVKSSFKVGFDFQIFGNYPLIAVAIWFGIVLMGYICVLYSYSAVATSLGLTSTQSSNSLAVLNASIAVGRPALGKIGDSLGRNNTSCVVCLVVGILLTGFWMKCTTYADFMVLAALIGGPLGIPSLMTQSMAHDILTLRGIPQKIPAAWGGINIIVGFFSLPAEVIALSLQTKRGTNLYRHAQIFGACTYFCGALILLVIREWLIRQKLLLSRREAEASLQQNIYTQSESEPHSNGPRPGENMAETAKRSIQEHNELLGNTPMHFFRRMFYPIHV